MSAEMTQSRLDKIRKDYETSVVLLKKHRYEAERQEKDRLNKIKEYRIQQMISTEKQKDAEPGGELPTSSKTKGKQRAIKSPNVLLKQRATKSLNQTSGEEPPLSSKTRQPTIPNPPIKRCSQSIESENDAIQSKSLKLLNTTKQSLNAVKAPVSNPNAPSTSNVVTKTKFAICWKLYYQAKFKTFLLKNKITLSDNQTEMNTKWIEVKTSDENKDIDFQRYCQLKYAC